MSQEEGVFLHRDEGELVEDPVEDRQENRDHRSDRNFPANTTSRLHFAPDSPNRGKGRLFTLPQPTGEQPAPSTSKKQGIAAVKAHRRRSDWRNPTIPKRRRIGCGDGSVEGKVRSGATVEAECSSGELHRRRLRRSNTVTGRDLRS